MLEYQLLVTARQQLDIPSHSVRGSVRQYEEINWSSVARKAIRTTIENLETMDEIAASNQLTEQEAHEIAESITDSANRRARDASDEEETSDASDREE